MNRRLRNLILPMALVALLASYAAIAAGELGRYQSRAEFLHESFATENPASGVVWLNGELRETAAEILGHAPAMLRVRYWYDGDKTAWIIDEIGKEQAITFGIVIENEAIQTLRVMQFRESRGWEIRYPFFTDQFSQLGLAQHRSGNRTLSDGIDAITGATLSVKAATRSATLALVLDEYTRRTEQHANADP